VRRKQRRNKRQAQNQQQRDGQRAAHSHHCNLASRRLP
jgi:hypothetical protein